MPSGFEENLDKHALGPFEYCVQTGSFGPYYVDILATRKALEVYEQLVVISNHLTLLNNRIFLRKILQH